MKQGRTHVESDLPGMEATSPARVDRIWRLGPGRVAGLLHGPLPNKSNSKQIVMIPRAGEDPERKALEAAVVAAMQTWQPTLRDLVMQQLALAWKRPLVIKSKEARQYDSVVEKAVAGAELGDDGPLDGVLYFRAMVHQKNLIRDLDCELLPDLLQKHGVIKNDRAIWKKDYVRRIDKDNPRVEFEIGLWEEAERGAHGPHP